MRARAEFTIEKRDGRVEQLRASKLCRSVFLALQGVGHRDPATALDVSSAVLGGLRATRDRGGPLRSQDVAAAVEKVLVATGFGAAAGRYGEVGRERSRRRDLWLWCERAVAERAAAPIAPQPRADREPGA